MHECNNNTWSVDFLLDFPFLLLFFWQSRQYHLPFGIDFSLILRQLRWNHIIFMSLSQHIMLPLSGPLQMQNVSSFKSPSFEWPSKSVVTPLVDGPSNLLDDDTAGLVYQYPKNFWHQASSEELLGFHQTGIPKWFILFDVLNVYRLGSLLEESKVSKQNHSMEHITNKKLCLNLVIVCMTLIKLKWITLLNQTKLSVTGYCFFNAILTMTVRALDFKYMFGTAVTLYNAIRWVSNVWPCWINKKATIWHVQVLLTVFTYCSLARCSYFCPHFVCLLLNNSG